MAISLLLPVVSTIHPLAFDTPMSSTPRRRDCRFSSVRPEGSRPSTGASMEAKATCASSIGTTLRSMPRRSASTPASWRDPSLE